MKLRYLLAASLLALASAGAQAATTLSFGTSTIGLGQSTTSGQFYAPSGFNHNWILNVSGENNFYLEFNDAEVSTTTVGNILNITGMNVNGGSALTFSNSGDRWFFQGNVADGAYSIMVSGTTAGLAGGLYTASLSAAPVPIPPAALLFGSALIGLAGLRRKKAAHEA